MAKRQRSKGTGTLFRRVEKGPWIASWFDHDGKRRQRSTRTTDRAAAERILAKHVADAALRRDMVIDPKAERQALEGRKPLTVQVEAYLAHCRHAGQSSKNIDGKKRHLDALVASMPAARLSDLTADALERHLESLKDNERSARTVNHVRQNAVAFYSWCVRTGRARSNPLEQVAKQDESRDRRRVRRPLADTELAALLEVAKAQGREAWYLCAAMAGLRRGDLQRLTWGDVNFAENSLTLRQGKAKREDVVPMHPQLADALRRRFKASPGTPATRVFPHTVTDRTRLNDFLRAGIARREVIRDAAGEPVMIGEGKRRRPKTRIVAEDDQGRIIDLHALRTTLGTQLARAGVAPQVAQRIMRHGDYRTTLKHYTVLGLEDSARALEALPRIGQEQGSTPGLAASNDGLPASSDAVADATERQLYCQQLERETTQFGAGPCDERRATGTDAADVNPAENGPYGPSHGMERTGLEPATSSLQSWHSTN